MALRPLCELLVRPFIKVRCNTADEMSPNTEVQNQVQACKSADVNSPKQASWLADSTKGTAKVHLTQRHLRFIHKRARS